MDLHIHGPAPGLVGRVRLPGDKSVTHRALLLAGLAEGSSRLTRPLRSGVTDVMLDSLGRLGVRFENPGDGDWLIHGGEWRTPGAALDCGNSGTTMRLLLGALAGQPLTAKLTGTPRLKQRPMARVVIPLREMGAQIEASNGRDSAPLTVHGSRLKGIEYRPRVASAQVKTAILLAGLFAEGRTVVDEPGPSRDHTERMLRDLGVELRISGRRIELTPPPRRLPAFDVSIPGDFSSAAFLLVAATLVPGSRVELPGVGVNPTRIGLLDALTSMGAGIEIGELPGQPVEPAADLRAHHRDLKGTRIGGEGVVRMIDEFPIFAVAATQAVGTSVVSDAAELRVKESDRIDSLALELRKMGAEIETRADGFAIQGPTRLHGARVQSHNDHRLAMALTVAGLIAEGETIIEDAGSISESFPGFTQILSDLGAVLA